MQPNPQPVDNPEMNEQVILNYYKEHYKTKICNEISFEASMNKTKMKAYQKFKSSCCCVKQLSLYL